MYPLTIGLVIGTKSLWEETQSTLKDRQVQILLEVAGVDNVPEFLERLQRMPPELMIVDVSSGNADAVIRGLRALGNPPFVIAIHTSADPQAIVTAMKSGANEFLYSPLAAGLEQGIQTASEQRQGLSRSRSRGRVLGVLSAKGGCGATTIACHLAVFLQTHTKEKVLLADFDLDAGLVGFLMKAKSPYTFVDAVRNVGRLDLSFWKALLSNGVPGVEVLPAPTGVAGRELIGLGELRHVMRFIADHYAWSVIDLGRGLNPLSLAALEEVDEVLLVTTLEVPTLHQAKHVLQTILNMGFRRDRLRVILNRTPRQSELTPEELESLLGVPLYKLLPEDYKTLYEAYSNCNLVRPDTKIGKYLTELAVSISGQSEKPRRKFSLFG